MCLSRFSLIEGSLERMCCSLDVKLIDSVGRVRKESSNPMAYTPPLSLLYCTRALVKRTISLNNNQLRAVSLYNRSKWVYLNGRPLTPVFLSCKLLFSGRTCFFIFQISLGSIYHHHTRLENQDVRVEILESGGKVWSDK